MWTPFHYREFYDVPRMVIARLDDDRIVFLDGSFDETLDEYPDTYRVYILLGFQEGDASSWSKFGATAARSLGAVRVSDVRFDATKRSLIDVSIPGLAEMLLRDAQRSS